ncbi:hypothetical protein GYH30_052321 [Glycine max]|uniref:Uncharacterized protein n=1 Tax=Glycine max TaxID=3847 RepID=K7MX39_SOYBN|nr:hypothetical protein GYH30_052321 [Glycine max]
MPPVPISPIKVGHIPDVQEVRKSKPRTIPQRFLSKGNKDEVLTELFNVVTGCEEWGIFQLNIYIYGHYVINHEIDLNLLQSIENLSREFFMLPLEEKQKYPMAPGTVQGYGEAFVLLEDEKLDRCNMFALGIEPEYVTNPNLWPNKPEKFSTKRGSLGGLSGEIRKLCYNMLAYIALGLGLKGDEFEKMFGESVQAMRMNYYPPCSRPDLVLGLSPHSYGTALTVL